MSKNLSNSVLLQAPERSTHNLTCETKTTTELGRLTPIFMMEVVPGDKVDLNAEFLTKFQPMLAPVMQNFNAQIDYFYIPFRILWRDWKYFIAQIPAPGESVPPIFPTIEFTSAGQVTHNNSNLAPYFGIFDHNNAKEMNPLPYAAYQLIYNEYYRHEKIHPDLTNDIILTSGAHGYNSTLNTLRYRTYKDDYFSAALTSPQAGEEAALNLLASAPLPVYRNDSPATSNNVKWQSTNVTGGAANETRAQNKLQNGGSGPINPYHLWADPADAAFQITLNELIELVRAQEFLIRSNLAGNRYNEFIKAHFGINVPDLRIDRPAYITGIKAPVVISEVLNTSSSQGFQTGQGNAYAEGGRANYEVLEHGLIMGIYSCIPSASYNNATPKLLWKNSVEDFYLPIFDQMGEQEILNKEVHLAHTDPEGTFGYIPKYAEYRLPFNTVTGEFRTTLSTWHLGRELNEFTILDAEFFDIINQDRIFEIYAETADPILLQVINKVYADRPMKKYGMPTLTNDYGNNLL